MGGSLRVLLPFAFLLLLSGCSPAYVFKSAAGHARLLWRRQSIERALEDPGLPGELKEKLSLVREVREFAFARMRLKESRDYSTYSQVPGPSLTTLVSASEKTELKPFLWWFPFAGSFPYKGYFSKEDARREKSRLERKGLDAHLSGVAAYNTPLWFSDPVPSTILAYQPGELSALILHELAHGTVFFKNRMAFNESLATFFGLQGAEEFLIQKYGEDSRQLADFRLWREREKAFQAAIEEIHERLSGLYLSPVSRQEKLAKREEIFSWGRGRLKEAGFELKELNNAVVLAHCLYHQDLDSFEAAYRKSGRDWARTIALLRSLDKRRPAEDLRRRLQAPDQDTP